MLGGKKNVRKSEESMDLYFNDNISDIVRLIIMYEYWFLHCDKHPIPTQDDGNRGNRGWRIWELGVILTLFLHLKVF